MTEPRDDDDFALGKEDICDDCRELVDDCCCNDRDRMYGDEEL
jgi:hypothetical protein